jgi:hypothetical protein
MGWAGHQVSGMCQGSGKTGSQKDIGKWPLIELWEWVSGGVWVYLS